MVRFIAARVLVAAVKTLAKLAIKLAGHGYFEIQIFRIKNG